MRYRAATFAAVVIGFAILCGTTQGYRFDAFKWPGGVVPYYNAAPDQAWAVAQAVLAWNRSGARIRFVAVPRSRAQLVIEEQPNRVYCSEGRATVGYYPRGDRVEIFRAHGITHACNRYWAARVMTHELGHVLGLQHEDRYCAAMNAVGNAHGGSHCDPRDLWEWRCRLLEADDIAGAVAAYGGTARAPRRTPTCPLYKAIEPVRHFTAAYDSTTRQVTLRFTRPAEPAIPAFVVPSPWRSRSSFAISGLGTECGTSDVPEVAPHFRWHVKPGDVETLVTAVAARRYCFAVWSVDRLGRPSDHAATASMGAS